MVRFQALNRVIKVNFLASALGERCRFEQRFDLLHAAPQRLRPHETLEAEHAYLAIHTCNMRAMPTRGRR